MIQLTNIEVQSRVVDFIAKGEKTSTAQIEKHVEGISRPTLSRYLKELKDKGIIVQSGKGRGAIYTVQKNGIQCYPLSLSLYDTYYRTAHPIHFNHTLFAGCPPLLTTEDTAQIQASNAGYATWKAVSTKEYQQLAFERCAIEFAWKSSTIEGNTYTLLETENLLKYKQEVKGKAHEEAVMILNQKKVFDLISDGSLLQTLSVATLIDMHKLLVADLGIPTGLRTRNVGITGTQYVPLTVSSQLAEALERLFSLLTKINDPLEKAIVALASIAYIQPFADGNKRVSRHTANLILHLHGLPPVAWRTVSEIEYKKAMIAFYELGNIAPIKELWLIHYRETIATFFGAKA